MAGSNVCLMLQYDSGVTRELIQERKHSFLDSIKIHIHGKERERERISLACLHEPSVRLEREDQPHPSPRKSENQTKHKDFICFLFMPYGVVFCLEEFLQ